jgi:hypothetical protein
MTKAGLGALALALLALGGCGGKEQLKPVQGQRVPAVPVGAATAPTGAQLMEPSVQSRPGRNVELLTQSRKRQDDEFDLPPEADPK